ncbi:MAG: MATE family efflux transporter, partial [Armatimonadetes bacterium]|nr:MATE family efflux transporter [Armatimonadota bacterium]
MALRQLISSHLATRYHARRPGWILEHADTPTAVRQARVSRCPVRRSRSESAKVGFPRSPAVVDQPARVVSPGAPTCRAMQRTTRPDLISDSIPRGLLYLAVPTWASHFLETSYNVVNGIWVGRVGTDSLAALNASAFFVWLVYSQLATVSTGASALVANAVGAGRRDQAERVAVQALSLALAMGTLLAFLGLALRHAVLELMGLEPGVVALGGAYLGIIFVIIPAMAIDECASAVLRGYGDTRTPTLVWSGVLLINIALAPLLVMGAGPVPAMGVRGAAMATAVGMSCGVLAYAALLGFGRLPFRIRLADFGAEHMRDVLRVGFPTSFSSVVFCLVYMGLTRVISEFGTEAVAAVGIGHRVESLSYMTCLALSIATITMVGQNKGAGRLDRAERSAWTAVGFGVAVTAVITLVMTVFSVPLARVFSDDPA